MIPVTRRKSSNPTLSPPRSEINPRINSRMWHFPLSSLSLSIYTEPAASFLIRLHREEAGRCLLLSKDSSTTSSLPGLAPPPPPLSAKLARRLLQSGRKERSPALVVPRFDLIGLPTFSWQNRSCLRLRRWKRPAFPLLPAVWRRFRPAGHSPPSPSSSSSSSGRKTFARWRTIESTERFVRFLPIFWRFSRTLRGNWRPALLDGRGGGGWRLDCSRKPAGERASQILRGGSGLFLWHRDEDGFERSKRILDLLDSFVKEILCRRLVRCGVVDRPEFLFPTSVTNWILILQDFKFESSMNNNLHGARSC